MAAKGRLAKGHWVQLQNKTRQGKARIGKRQERQEAMVQ